VPVLEEPLDMSIKTRKRHSAEDSYNFVKKHRPSVIYFGRGGTSHPSSGSEDDLQSNSSSTAPFSRQEDATTPVLDFEETPEAVPRRVIITHDDNEDGGLEEHFRRSLSKDYAAEVDAQGGNGK
jgi:hypothetical protein